MLKKKFDSKMYFPKKNSDTHYLHVRSQMAREKDYPLKTNSNIKSAIVGNMVVFFNEGEEEHIPTDVELIKQELRDEEYDPNDPMTW